MLSRVVIGVVAGAVAGLGHSQSRDLLDWICRQSRSAPACGEVTSSLESLSFLFWAVVAGLAVFTGFRIAGQERAGWTALAGGLFWYVLTPVVLFVLILSAPAEPGPASNLVAEAVWTYFTPCAAYTLAGVATAGYGGRRDRAEHRGQDG